MKQINDKSYQEFDIIMLSEKTNNVLISDRKHLILNDNKIFNPFKNEYYNLYVLSFDKTIGGDWVYNVKINNIFQIPYKPDNNFIENVDMRDCKKIIATSDSSLRLKCNHCKGTGTTNESHEANSPYDKPCSSCYGGFIKISQIHQSFIEHFITEYNKGNVINKLLVEVENINSNDCFGECGICDSSCNPIWKLKLNNNEISILIKENNWLSIQEHGRTLEYWKNNAEEDYMKVPISVLKYITCLEEALKTSIR